MSEGFNLVRTIRQHLRRSAELLDEGKFEDALAEADAALALDPQSLQGQLQRDRILATRAAQQTATPRPAAEDGPASRSFVPYGVNAASWRGFEQRITERRFKALLDTINTSIVAGDAVSARLALEEARELRPDAPELAEFEARVSAVPVIVAVPDSVPPTRIWMRALGAAALFLVGVSLLLGIEWMRPGEIASPATTAPAPLVAPAQAPGEEPALAPRQESGPATTPDLGAVPVAMNEEDESVPAIITPPEPLQPRATTGPSRATELAARSMAMRDVAPPAVERTVIERRPVAEEQTSGPSGEVSDDYVAAPRPTAATADAGRTIVPSRRTLDTPVSADTRGRGDEPAATTASAVVLPGEQSRVEDVLRRYARAYGELDASAARAVWPSVDERALARAFQNLSSQNVSFDDCEIDIRGAVANASCRGQASYAPKVGNRESRTELRTWRFELRREGNAWKIENAEARRQPSAEYREP